MTSPFPSRLRACDARFKACIQRIGETPSGLPVYRWSEPGTGEVWQGVMAQDVLRHTPQAVTRTSTGALLVDYARIDADMVRVH